MSTPTLPRLQAPDGLAPLLEALEEGGGAIVEDLVPRDALARILDDVEPHIEQADPAMTHVNSVLQTFYRGVRNVTGLAGKSPAYVESVLLHPLLLGVADTVLGSNCASYTLNVAHLMVREPGAEQQWLHRDQEVWSFLPTPHPEVEVSVVVALDDFTADNGATVVAPGSHRWDPRRRPEEHELVAAEMPAGAGLVYLGSTIHAGGANRTDRGRTGVHMSYVVGWLRPEENNTLATPPEVARSLPRRAQELIGYAMHDATSVGGGYLGCVDLRDPTDLLRAGVL